jgi:alanine dehydrogenase
MPGAVPITSTYALTNATLPYVLEIAKHGPSAVPSGINVAGGQVTHPAVADAVGMELAVN